MSITVDVDMRPSLGPARDQGQRPTCFAFAASAAHERARANAAHLSVEYLHYFGVRRSHQNPNRGLNSAAVTAALRDDGQPIEAAWPYVGTAPVAATWGRPMTTEPFHKATLALSSRTVDEVRALVQALRPVVLLMAVTTALYLPDADGLVHSTASDTITAGRHALLAVGSGHSSSTSYLLVRNSWGLGWGLNGHAWLTDAYISANLRDTAIIS